MAEVHETGNYVLENGKNIGIRKLKHHIKALRDVKSKKRSLFSLVIAPWEEISHLINKIEDWKKDTVNYEHAIDAMTYAQQVLQKYSNVPDNGLIIYTGIVYTDDGSEDVTIGFEPFKQIYNRTNRILCKFNMEPLTKLLEPVPIPLRCIREGRLLTNFSYEKKFVYGVDTWKRLGDVKILFVCENLDINYYRLKNTRTGEVVTKHLNKEQENDKSNFRDSKTNDELQILEKTPLLDWLYQVHQDKLFGYKLEFVSDTTPDGKVFCKFYGGIGGILGDEVNIEAYVWVQSFAVLLVGLVAYLVTRSTFKLMMDK